MTDNYKFVKVFGERNTGTRALIRMLSGQPEIWMRPKGEARAINLPQNAMLRAKIDTAYSGKWRDIYHDALKDDEQALACSTRAWKHTRPIWDDVFVQKQAHVIFCVRNPYSWALSLFRRPYHQKATKPKRMLDFVTQPWMTVARDNMPTVLRSPLELWNAKVTAYGRFMDVACVPTRLVRFERFVANPIEEVKGALTELGIPFGNINRLESSTKNPIRTVGDISIYYRKEDWKGELTQEVVTAINAVINWKIATKYGYNQLKPSDFPSEFTLKNLSRNHSLMTR